VLSRGARADEEVTAEEAPVRADLLPVVTKRIVPTARGELLLQVEGITKRFGGVTALSDVTFDLYAGETLGLIGPNGAGKTTLFDVLSGFVRADEGRVLFTGRDVSRWRPEARGRAGIIRSFQDAALFPTLTVQQVVQIAMERTDPTPVVPSLFGFHGSDRRKERAALELLELLGLLRYRDTQVARLSTGTRHIAEIACLLALEPALLLLDEPSSGIAQRETEALTELLQSVKQQLRTTLVIIEHDMPMIMSLSDRILAMDAGAVVAVGSPTGVRENPIVVESYLGGDITAIERSGTAGAPPRRPAESGSPR
jgi:ABC-type branched-subunit amino acid transport system ATPase component